MAQANSPAKGYVRSDRVNAVVYRGADNHIHELSLSNGWHDGDLFAWTVNPVPAASAPAAYIRSDGFNSVVFTGSDQFIYELSLQSGCWCLGNLSTYHGLQNAAPLASPQATPAAYRRSDGYNSVVYRGYDSHIYELYLGTDGWDIGGDLLSWTVNPVTAETDPFAYVRADNVNAVVYVGWDYHIHELRLAGTWQDTDLSARTSAPPASIVLKPAAYIRYDGASSVVYTGTDGHVNELSLSNGVWSWSDLSAQAGIYPAASSPAAYRRSDLYNSVVYRGYGNHIYELYRYFTDSTWHIGDLSSAARDANGNTGNTPPSNSAPAAYVRSDSYNSVVYRGTDNQMHELSLYPGQVWHWGTLGGNVGN